MERARATWTDERLDDLSLRVDSGFTRLDGDIRALRSDLGARIDGMEGKLGARIDGMEGKLGARIDGVEGKLGARIDGVETSLSARIDSLQRSIEGLQRMMIQFAGGLTIAIIATLVTVIATRA